MEHIKFFPWRLRAAFTRQRYFDQPQKSDLHVFVKHAVTIDYAYESNTTGRVYPERYCFHRKKKTFHILMLHAFGLCSAIDDF